MQVKIIELLFIVVLCLFTQAGCTNNLFQFGVVVFFEDASKSGNIFVVCVIVCAYVGRVGFSNESTMESYIHSAPSLTKVKPLNKYGAPVITYMCIH